MGALWVFYFVLALGIEPKASKKVGKLSLPWVIPLVLLKFWSRILLSCHSWPKGGAGEGKEVEEGREEEEKREKTVCWFLSFCLRQIPFPWAVLSQSSHGFLLYYEGWIIFWIISLVHLGFHVSLILWWDYKNFNSNLASKGFQGKNENIKQLCTSEKEADFLPHFGWFTPLVY